MHFTASWSGEIAKTAWRKREISLDESDLRRVCLDYDIDYDTLTSRDAFEVLESYGNMLLTVELITRFPEQFGSPEYAQEAASLTSQLKAKVNAIRIRQAG